MGATYDHLKEMLIDSAVGLADVVPRKMFGCDALFRGGGGGAKDQIFALVWKQDRIGVRLPDDAAFHDAMKLDGAAPWAPMGTRGMAHWVMLPEEMHDVPEDVAAWVARAHALAVGGAPAKKAPAKKAPAKKAPAKKASSIEKRSPAKRAAVKKPAAKPATKAATKPATKAATKSTPRKPAKKRTKR